jgi:hypothetical protein
MPMVMVQRRSKLAAMPVAGLVMSVLGAAITILMLVSPAGPSLIWLLILSFDTLAVGMLWFGVANLIRPAVLNIDEAGVSIRTFRGTRSWTWDRVSNIRRYVAPRGFFPTAIAFNVSAAGAKRPSTAILPGGWPTSLRNVVTHLEEARRSFFVAKGVQDPSSSSSPLVMSTSEAVFLGLLPFMLLVVVVTSVVVTHSNDVMSDGFIQKREFLRLPNCPLNIAAGSYLPARCDDARYRIREGASGYGLPQIKGSHWLRVGKDAVHIGFCGMIACDVDRVEPGKFPG